MFYQFRDADSVAEILGSIQLRRRRLEGYARDHLCLAPYSLLEESQIEALKAFRIAEHVNLDDLAPPNREPHH
jgi:hypothetical protein